MAAAILTMVAYLIGIVGYAMRIRAQSPGRDRASLIDAAVISTGVGMRAWVFLASPYSADSSLPTIESCRCCTSSSTCSSWPWSSAWPSAAATAAGRTCS